MNIIMSHVTNRLTTNHIKLIVFFFFCNYPIYIYIYIYIYILYNNIFMKNIHDSCKLANKFSLHVFISGS
jgi:hypothetical protein